MSFIRAFLLLAIPALLACAAGTITYRNCTDRALCLSGCNEAVVPTDVCFATSGVQILSEIISCVPQIRVCGDLSYYTDAFCTQLAHTDGFVCDQCNPDSGNGGTFNEAVCSRHIDGHEYLALLVCGTPPPPDKHKKMSNHIS
ncbi:cysteine proteinase-like, putative [Bodo saltans]|uniref:Cysteine proteinase-like, putative n=1 Tax=Bodo saltans TaxID=75058 RepID=A0A0S4IS70_BODSA|nr:cysteine proteinase-like, putative [Bodo saltans]|eukprot:CUG05184.1 cysteine proteinase-like, putative [Bodo saltans]